MKGAIFSKVVTSLICVSKMAECVMNFFEMLKWKKNPLTAVYLYSLLHYTPTFEVLSLLIETNI